MNSNDKSILSITMLAHGVVHMQELAIPIFITVWIQQFGVDAAVIGTVVSAGYALYGIGAVIGGVATDRFGSISLVRVCLLGIGSAFMLLAVVGNMLGVAAALILWGAAASIYHPAGLRLISNGVTQRGSGYAYHGIAGNIGIAVGPLVATVLLIALDWQIVAAAMSLPALFGAAWLSYVSVDETAAVSEEESTSVTDAGRTSLSEFLSNTKQLFLGGLLIVFPILMLEGFFYRGILTFLPDLLAGYESLSPFNVGGRSIEPSRYVFIGVLVVGMAGQYVGGILSERFAPERVLVGAFLALAVISLLFIPSLSAGLLPLLLVTGLLGFVLFGEQPLLQAVVANSSGAGVLGLSFGYMFLGVFGVGALGAAFSGFVLTYLPQQMLFILLAVPPGLAALIAVVVVGQNNTSETPTDAPH
jgi:MFS family permease